MRRVIFAAALLIATTVSLTTVKRPLGTPRLVSVEELPDYSEICPPEPPAQGGELGTRLDRRVIGARAGGGLAVGLVAGWAGVAPAGEVRGRTRQRRAPGRGGAATPQGMWSGAR